MSEMIEEVKAFVLAFESRMMGRLDEVHKKLDRIASKSRTRLDRQREEYLDMFRMTEARLRDVKYLIEGPAETLEEATLRMIRDSRRQRGLPEMEPEPEMPVLPDEKKEPEPEPEPEPESEPEQEPEQEPESEPEQESS